MKVNIEVDFTFDMTNLEETDYRILAFKNKSAIIRAIQEFSLFYFDDTTEEKDYYTLIPAIGYHITPNIWKSVKLPTRIEGTEEKPVSARKLAQLVYNGNIKGIQKGERVGWQDHPDIEGMHTLASDKIRISRIWIIGKDEDPSVRGT